MQSEEVFFGHCVSPIGLLLVAGDRDRLDMIGFPTGSRVKSPEPGWMQDNSRFKEVFRQLDAYFAKKLRKFELPLCFRGTDFQNSVWHALCDIPYGHTKSYGEIAVRIGRPKASRAVGAANGANPLPIVVPCHRVIGADNSLTGFGGGLGTKQFLLELEAES